MRENDRDTGKTVVYEYDNYGNIEKKTEYAFTLGELGAVVDTISYAYNDTSWKDKLTSYDGQDITYDEIGNPITYRGATMTWVGRQMMSYSKNGTSISYTYDADGLRTSKTINDIKHDYYYVDGQLRYERNGDNYEIYYTYDADGRPVLATKRDLVAKKNYQYYLITNTRGDVIETRDDYGNVSAKFVYDAWGKLVSVTDASGNALSQNSFAYQISLKYRGYVYDNETGLYYLQSRYYDPETGRFLNADEVDYIGYSGEQLSYNMFAYCENNSVNLKDAKGFTAGAATNNIIYEQLLKTLPAIFASAASGIEAIAIAVIIALVVEIIAKAIKYDTASLKTKYLEDIEATLQKQDMPVYRFAYVDDLTNDLVITPKYMTFVEVLTILGVSNATYTLSKTYSIKDDPPSVVKGINWGVHSNLQIHAKLLATVLGWKKGPEVHRSGYYGHYHDANHIIHIWYGQKVFY